MSNSTKVDLNEDGIDRRGFLKCMAWAGTGALWSAGGGIVSAHMLGQAKQQAADFSFVQVSDSHIGFTKEANPDVIGTFRRTIAKINALPETPDFLIHTGDLTHLSKPAEFDSLDQLLRTCKATQVFFVPGEHDMLVDNGQQYRERFGKGSQGAGWYSFDHKGTHFVALVNVVDLKSGGLGNLGAEQLAWLKKDLESHSNSVPMIVFAHIPLWTIYPEWGWGTDDGAQALAYLKRFGSVTVLNGHIHQTMQKIEGNITFHTARSTAFPQPAPGSAPSPGPVKVPADQLRDMLGMTQVSYVVGLHSLAIVDSSLGTGGQTDVSIDNFSFVPPSLTVKAGTAVTWINKDDMPHNIVNAAGKFISPVLDTDQTYSFTFKEPGTYPYYCRLHPMMKATITVTGG